MDATLQLSRHKLDVAAFERMGETGILGHEERIELIDGELIDMAPIGELHAASVTALNQALVRACGDAGLVSPQNPVLLDRLNLPQPDFAILRPRADFYVRQRPGPADILLLIEVADSSIRFDRTIKLPLYARAGIAEFWIIDLRNRVLHAHRDPAATGYATATTHHPGEAIALALVPEIAISLNRVFG